MCSQTDGTIGSNAGCSDHTHLPHYGVIEVGLSQDIGALCQEKKICSCYSREPQNRCRYLIDLSTPYRMDIVNMDIVLSVAYTQHIVELQPIKQRLARFVHCVVHD